jgi:hypothetical protein
VTAGTGANHQSVYAAEQTAFGGTDLEELIGFDAAAALIVSITAGEWWPGPLVTVGPARSAANSSSARNVWTTPRNVAISLAAGQLTRATALHELAHALAGVEAGHDARFRRAHLDVVAVGTNIDSTDRRGDLHVRQLAAAYRDARLGVADRRWAAPPGRLVGGPIAL